VVGNNVDVSVSLETKEEGDHIFAAFSVHGGTVVRPLGKMPWGSYYGVCKENFGIQWMFDTESNDKKKDKDEKVQLKRAICSSPYGRRWCYESRQNIEGAFEILLPTWNSSTHGPPRASFPSKASWNHGTGQIDRSNLASKV